MIPNNKIVKLIQDVLMAFMFCRGDGNCILIDFSVNLMGREDKFSIKKKNSEKCYLFDDVEVKHFHLQCTENF